MHKSTASFLGMGLAALLSAVADHHKPSVSLDGKWDVTAAIDDFETRDSTLTLSHADGKWKGIMVGEDGESRDFDRVNIDGHTLIIELDVSQNGQNGVLGAKAELQKDGELSGKWYLRGDDGVEYMTNDWEAVRSLANVAAGNWKATAFTPEGDLNYTLNLSNKGSSFNGTVASGQGALELSKVKIDKNTLTTENPYGDGSVKVVAKLTEASKLKGQWFYRDEFGAEVADGEWFATKPSEYAALLGDWAVTLTAGDFTEWADLSFKEKNGRLVSIYQGSDGEKITANSVSFKGGKLVTKTDRDFNNEAVTWVLEVNVNAGKLSGSLVPKGASQPFEVSVSGKKK